MIDARADVAGFGADQAAAPALLRDVRVPADDAAHRERRREKAPVDAERVEQHRGVKFDVRAQDARGVPLWISTTCFAVLLAGVFGVWYARERTLSIHSIVTRPHRPHEEEVMMLRRSSTCSATFAAAVPTR